MLTDMCLFLYSLLIGRLHCIADTSFNLMLVLSASTHVFIAHTKTWAM